MVKNGGKIIAPVSVQRWALTSDMDGLLDFSLENLDSFPVDLVIGLRLVFPDCRCRLFLMFTQSLLQSSRCLLQNFSDLVTRIIFVYFTTKVKMNVHSHVYYIVHMIGHNERFVGADEP